MVSKRDFEATAAIIKKLFWHNDSMRAIVALEFAEYFKEQNKNFDISRFLAATKGVPEDVARLRAKYKGKSNDE